MKNYIPTAWRLNVKFYNVKGGEIILGLRGVKLEITLGLPVGCLVLLPACTQAPSKFVAIIYPCTCDYRAPEYTWLNKNNVLLWQMV